jgi:hypothetical protein
MVDSDLLSAIADDRRDEPPRALADGDSRLRMLVLDHAGLGPADIAVRHLLQRDASALMTKSLTESL